LLTVAGFQLPATPLSEVEGKAGTALFAQIVNVVPNENVGVTTGFTVTFSVVTTAHCAASGVNVYDAEVLLSIADGLHVPEIPLFEIIGKPGAVAPWHILSDVPNANDGVMFGLTVTVNVLLNAHCPADGVNVYTPDAVLLTVAGFHEPVTALFEVDGKAGTVPPEHIVSVAPKLNEGSVFGLTVTVNVAPVAHCPAEGVNV
jgi:hypothetical protein